MPKTLFELCQPRPETITGVDKDDTQELDLLLKNQIDPNDFFSKCFITANMERLFDMAFARFGGKSDGSGLIVLKQSMGGGKTHNMIALGLLAQYPSLRKPILGDKLSNVYKDKIPVVGFTGRNTTELPWISIADQLNRTNLLKPKVRDEMEAPSDREWRELLGDGPILILLDEMPFYFEHAETVPKGDSNKAVFVSAGLANLFNAINSQDLSRAVIVLSDLEAQYERGSEFVINKTALSLKDEAERTAQMIKPIDITSPEIYEILRKRLFAQYPADPETDPGVDAVAKDYFKFISDIEKAGLISPDAVNKVTLRFKECYPFHPIIVDLIANFKNNLRFQQTRGLLRLFRRYVRYLYTNKDKFPDKRFITVSDYDLSRDGDNDMSTLITSINQDLENAIRNDVYSSDGVSAAQTIDKKYKTNLADKFAKAILFASLSATDPDLSGLSEEEIYLATLEPADDTAKARTILDEYWRSTLYSKENQRGKRYFGYNENVVSQMTRQRLQITKDEAENILTMALKAYFTPRDRDCYQAVYQKIVALPIDIADLQLERDKTMLVISKPVDQHKNLNDTLGRWWERQERNKNRIMFLTGADKDYNALLEALKNYLAWDKVFTALGSQVNPTDPEYKRAEKETINSRMVVLEKIKTTFSRLYYPSHDEVNRKDLLQSLDIDYSFIAPNPASSISASRNSGFYPNDKIDRLLGNDRDGETVIKQSLKKEDKYIEININDTRAIRDFDAQVQHYLLGNTIRERITLDEILQRAADRPSWYWHEPGVLEEYVGWKAENEEWIEDDDEIIINPQFKASVEVIDADYDFENDEIILRLKVNKYTDTVYYSAGDTFDENNKAEADIYSPLRLKPGRNAKYTFVAIDSTGKNADSDPYVYTCPIELKKIGEFTDSDGIKHITIKSLPEADIYYTTDGTSPINSSTRQLVSGNEIVIDPTQVKKVIIAAQLGEEHSRIMEIETANKRIALDKPVDYEPLSKNYIRFDSKDSFYAELQKAKSYKAKIDGANIDIKSSSGREITVMITDEGGLEADWLQDMTETIINHLKENDEPEINGYLEKFYFESGKDFIEWLDLYGKKPEDCISEYMQG